LKETTEFEEGWYEHCDAGGHPPSQV